MPMPTITATIATTTIIVTQAISSIAATHDDHYGHRRRRPPAGPPPPPGPSTMTTPPHLRHARAKQPWPPPPPATTTTTFSPTPHMCRGHATGSLRFHPLPDPPHSATIILDMSRERSHDSGGYRRLDSGRHLHGVESMKTCWGTGWLVVCGFIMALAVGRGRWG